MSQSKISQTIQTLLLEHNYVIIPQLGGFVSKYQSAQLISDENIIQAPSQSISFNADLKDDDGLLVKALAKRENITVSSAEELIKKFVKESFLRLDEGRSVALEKIGKLKFNKQLNIEFELDKTENYNPYSYGMVDVNCYALSDNEIVQKQKRQIFSRSTLKKVAVVIPFLLVGAILSIYLNQIGVFSTQSNQEASVLPQITEKIERKQDNNENLSIAEQIDYKTNQKNALALPEPVKNLSENESIETVPAELPKEQFKEVKIEAPIQEKQVEEKVIIEAPVKTEIKKYQLVAGSFKSQANAKRFAKKFNKLDLEPEIIKQGNKYRVIASSFSSKSEAVQVKDSLKEHKVSTWINTLK